MKIQIKHRFNGKVLFKGEYRSTKEAVLEALKSADLRGADLRGTDLRGADLRGANLCDADLRGVNLRGANLCDANLHDAKIDDGIKVSLIPYQLECHDYFVYIWDKHIKIGCEFHSMDEWFDFTDKGILAMDGKKGLKWWKIWKELIKGICVNTGRWSPKSMKLEPSKPLNG